MNRREERKERLRLEKMVNKQNSAIDSLWDMLKEEFMILKVMIPLDSYDLTRYIFEIFMTRHIMIECFMGPFSTLLLYTSVRTIFFPPCEYFVKRLIRQLLEANGWSTQNLSTGICYYSTKETFHTPNFNNTESIQNCFFTKGYGDMIRIASTITKRYKDVRDD